MRYVILYFIGFGMVVSGGVTLILYMNFLPAGVSWPEYFYFIATRMECYLFPIGFIFICFSIGKFSLYLNKNE